MKTLDRLMQCLGYQFNDSALLELALTHRSVSRNRNYERLEFLGDAQLEQVISVWLFHHFPDTDEGKLTRMRSQLVRGKTLAAIGRELDLGSYLRLGSGELKSGGFRRDSILEDCVEAIIGAILLDGGHTQSRDCILRWFDQRLQKISPDIVLKDAKTRLQEWLQARKFPLPDYTQLSVVGQPPEQTFMVQCMLDEQQHSVTAEGSSRRRAEQLAAEKALQWLEQQHG